MLSTTTCILIIPYVNNTLFPTKYLMAPMLGFSCVRDTVLELLRSDSMLIIHIILEFIVDVKHASGVTGFGVGSQLRHCAPARAWEGAATL